MPCTLRASLPRRSIQTVVYPAGAGTISGGGVYSLGESVTLTASPAGCFDYWREKRSQQSFPNPYTFTVGADRSLEAIFTTGTCTQPPATSRPPRFSVSEPARLAVVQTPIVALGSLAGTGQPAVFPGDGPMSNGMGTCNAIV